MNHDLKEVLELLSNSNIDLEKEKDTIIDLFSKVYKNKNYRHKYSEIFLIMKRIDRSSNKKDMGVLYIVQNLGYVIEKFNFQQPHIILKLEKLQDHINLEYARDEYIKDEIKDIYIDIKNVYQDMSKQKQDSINIIKEMTKISESFEATKELIVQQTSDIKQTEDKIKQTEDKIKQTEDKIKETEEKLEKSKYDIVTIISVMVSIFTLLGVNASIISGLFTLAHQKEIVTIPFAEVICLFILANVIVFSGIYFILAFLKKLKNK